MPSKNGVKRILPFLRRPFYFFNPPPKKFSISFDRDNFTFIYAIPELQKLVYLVINANTFLNILHPFLAIIRFASEIERMLFLKEDVKISEVHVSMKHAPVKVSSERTHTTLEWIDSTIKPERVWE